MDFSTENQIHLKDMPGIMFESGNSDSNNFTC